MPQTAAGGGVFYGGPSSGSGTAAEELAESVALLYYPVTVHHDFLEGNRITQLAYEGARHLQRKLGMFYAGFEVDRHELDPPMD